MNKQEKNQVIDELKEKLVKNKSFYLADTSELTGIKINIFRRLCFEKQVELRVVKNTLLKKAMEKTGNGDLEPMYRNLAGNTAILFSENPSEPARLIKQFRISENKPLLKSAYIEESVYMGDEQLEFISTLKTKNELIADIIGLLQSPAKRVISALQSGGHKISGVLKKLSEREEK